MVGTIGYSEEQPVRRCEPTLTQLPGRALHCIRPSPGPMAQKANHGSGLSPTCASCPLLLTADAGERAIMSVAPRLATATMCGASISLNLGTSPPAYSNAP